MPLNPDTATVLDLVAAYPATEAVFRRYDGPAGCCILCQALFETITTLAVRFGLDCDALLSDLNRIIEQGSHP